MQNSPINLMIVESNKLIRVGLESLFEENNNINVVLCTESAKIALEEASNRAPDVIIIDLQLLDTSGFTFIKALQERDISTKVIILTSNTNFEDIIKALSLGVYAYIIKDINTEILVFIVQSVATGAIWLDPKIVPILREKSNRIIPQKQTTRANFRNTHSNLTQREYEVLKLVVDGMSNIEIAQTLCISEHTAKAHVCNIIQKLLVDDRTQAAIKAIREGIV